MTAEELRALHRLLTRYAQEQHDMERVRTMTVGALAVEIGRRRRELARSTREFHRDMEY